MENANRGKQQVIDTSLRFLAGAAGLPSEWSLIIDGDAEDECRIWLVQWWEWEWRWRQALADELQRSDDIELQRCWKPAAQTMLESLCSDHCELLNHGWERYADPAVQFGKHLQLGLAKLASGRAQRFRLHAEVLCQRPLAWKPKLVGPLRLSAWYASHTYFFSTCLLDIK